MSVFENSRACRIVAGDAAEGRLSHAYLLVCPDERNLRGFLKELAVYILRADERAARLIAAERYADCRVFPAEGQKATVADVKELLEDAYIRPTEGDAKLFVFDRMQEMLPPAQNKLLKVLEEPPQGVYFLLGTTSEFPVLPTIRSRAKRLDLFSFSQKEVEAHLRARYPYLQDAAWIAAASDGVLGRAEQLAEEWAASGTEQELAMLALTLSPAGIPAAARKYAEKGMGARFFPLFRLILRDLLMLKLGREDLCLSGADRDILRRAAARYSEATLVSALEGIEKAEKNLKFNANLSMSLEELFAAIVEGR